MNIGRYLPSTQFVVIVGAIALSGGLVAAAQYVMHPTADQPSLLTVANQASVPASDWLASLHEVEGTNIDSNPNTSIAEAKTNLLGAAQSANVTDTVARTLLVNVADAKSQGLGSDLPTQDKLVEEAAAQMQQVRAKPGFTDADLVLSDNSTDAYKKYGNAVIEAFGRYPEITFERTVKAIGRAATTTSASLTAELSLIQKKEYALAKELALIPVPPPVEPFHLQIVNDLSAIGATYTGMATILSDPLQGLGAFQLYQALLNETQRVFINIAQQLDQNGILFSKEEPGSAWALFLSQ
jgi:hypothetical protein